MFLSLQFKKLFFFLFRKSRQKTMFDSMLDGYDKADFNKMLLLIFSPEYVEYDKPSQTTKL